MSSSRSFNVGIPYLMITLCKTPTMQNPENKDNTDNRYAKGTFVYAKAHPELKLVIDAYKARIYYCAVAGHPEMKQLAYFDRELIEPGTAK